MRNEIPFIMPIPQGAWWDIDNFRKFPNFVEFHYIFSPPHPGTSTLLLYDESLGM